MKYFKFLSSSIFIILVIVAAHASEKNLGFEEVSSDLVLYGNAGSILQNPEVSLKVNEDRQENECFTRENGEIIKFPINTQEIEQRHQQIITILPPIAQLETIQVLNLSSNKITFLPPELGNLRNLHTLQLKNNYLTFLDEEIFKRLRNLQLLNLDENRLGEIPEGGDINTIKIPAALIGPKLSKLRFTGNRLSITQVDPAVFAANEQETNPDNPTDPKEYRRISPAKEDLTVYKDTLKSGWGSLRKWTNL